MEKRIEVSTITEEQRQSFIKKYYSAVTRWINRRAQLGYEAYEVDDIFGHQIQIIENKAPGAKVIRYLHIDPQTLKMGLFKRNEDGTMELVSK